MQVTAFHKWLMEVSGGDEELIAQKLYKLVVLDMNRQAIDLFNEAKSFEKAAKLVIELTKNKSDGTPE